MNHVISDGRAVDEECESSGGLVEFKASRHRWSAQDGI